MSLIRKIEGGLLTAYVMRDAISCSDFVCRVCQDAALVRYWRRQCRAVMLLDLSDISLDSHWTQPPFLMANEDCFYYICFPSAPEHIYARDQCGWQTQLHACVEHAEGPRECVCSPMHDMQRGQNGYPVLRALGKGALFFLLFDTKGWRGRRVDVCEIHHTADSLLQWSVAPPPPPAALLHLLISSPQSCACWPFVYSSFQWSTPVITVTGCMTLWRAVSVGRDGQDGY